MGRKVCPTETPAYDRSLDGPIFKQKKLTKVPGTD
jgi:hypothetical protein